MRRLADVEAEAARERACTYLDREVRQGGSLVVAVPGATADNLPKVTCASPELEAKPRLVGDTVVVDVMAKHGAALGDIPDHKVTIAATIGGRIYERELLVLVQGIAASPLGDDNNVGSENEPFRTFRKAASVAERGDTIFLRNDDRGGPSEPDERAEIVIPVGVAVRGQVTSHDRTTTPAADDPNAPTTLRAGTILNMPLRFAGHATLDNLVIDQRLTVEMEDSNVLLNDVDAVGGVAVAKSANHATLTITGSSRVRTDAATHNPVLVEADDTTLTLEGATYIDHGGVGGTTDIPTVKLTGHGQHLNLRGDVRIQSLKGPVAIQIDDAQTVEIIGRVPNCLDKNCMVILGRLDITGVDSMVTVKNTIFSQGIKGSGIVFKAGGTTSSMLIEHSLFGDEGIVIDGPQSKVTVRNTKFEGITKSAIRLIAGTLDLGTALEAGHNAFRTTGDEKNPELPVPVALQIDADVGQASVTSSASTYDGMNPGRCDIAGPVPKETVVRGFVKIANAITIEFFP